MKINTEDLRQYMTIGFVIALLVYFILLTILTIAFFLGWVSPEKIPRPDWWTALGIVVTLTLAILIMNFVRERTYNETQKKLIEDYNETQQRIKQAESEVENTKQLSTLSTILLNIATEENSNKEKWEENFTSIENLFNLGFISDKDLYRVSLVAWKQGDVNFAFRCRKLAYDSKSDKLKNKLYLLSILAYIEIDDINPLYIDENIKRLHGYPSFFLDEIGFEQTKSEPLEYSTKDFFKKNKEISNSDECFAYALTGRYFFKLKMYADSKYFFELAINKSEQIRNWHYRHLLELNLVELENKEINDDNLSPLMKNLEIVKTLKEWQEDYRYIAFQQLIENIIHVAKGEKAEPANLLSILKGINVAQFDKFSMWNFNKILDKLDVDGKKRNEIEQLYYNYYLVHGNADKDFEEKYSPIIIDLEKEKYLNTIIGN